MKMTELAEKQEEVLEKQGAVQEEQPMPAEATPHESQPESAPQPVKPEKGLPLNQIPEEHRKKLLEQINRDLEKVTECEHSYIVVNKKLTSKSESASQIMCQKCLHLADFSDVSKANEFFRQKLGMKAALEAANKNDDNSAPNI